MTNHSWVKHLYLCYINPCPSLSKKTPQKNRIANEYNKQYYNGAN